ncbi:HNH endonuclease [Idiomarina seosinensis]|uniref:HNH endonuclease n=1 Tax=Idiomarina seosinensis TaxID=281739 RepID=UPI0013006CC5|nr:HNH endonuclease [Idiomarina seosinensis]
MPISFKNIAINKAYTRPQLTDIWGLGGPQAIARGVFTPANANIIILFVTHDKRDDSTPYDDHILGDVLYWEGEKGHLNDKRIANAHVNADEVHLFYRDHHRDPFTYLGLLTLIQFKEKKDKPSEFQFLINEYALFDENELKEPGIDPQTFVSETKREIIINARLGQQHFRRQLIQRWQSCSVTGIKKQDVLLASHIKPWRLSSNGEKLDAYNGLLLTPALDLLFDKGIVTFRQNKKIVLSSQLASWEYQKMGIDSAMKLRELPIRTSNYLEYHRDVIFKHI